MEAEEGGWEDDIYVCKHRTRDAKLGEVRTLQACNYQGGDYYGRYLDSISVGCNELRVCATLEREMSIEKEKGMNLTPPSTPPTRNHFF